MSNVGATTGDEPDYVDDADLLSLDEMRGAMKDISAAALTNVEKATVRGCLDELGLIKTVLNESIDQNNKLVALYSTLRNEFNTFKAVHAANMNVRVNGGSTTPEDIDGPDAGPRH